jgi:ferredoxin--NADP+ reductase
VDESPPRICLPRKIRSRREATGNTLVCDSNHSTASGMLRESSTETGATVFKIAHAEFIATGIKRFEIEAPRIARKHKAGQFIILRVYDQGERIPITIENSNPEHGTISIVVQSVGKTTRLLNTLKTGDNILDVVGPLGKPSEIALFGSVVVVGGGVGVAMAYPTAAALKRAGNHMISIIGARNKELVILEREMRRVSDELMITTDDGSYAEKGMVTDKLRQLLDNHTPTDLVLAVGPIPMMRAVVEMTRKGPIRTIVSLNPIMIDGTGMCGGCRVLVDGRSQFACVDGPEFDGHRVDFAVLMQRNATYCEAENRSMEEFLHGLEPNAAGIPDDAGYAVQGGRR